MLVSDFVSHVRRAGQLPTTVTSQLATSDILAHADMEIQSVLLPEVRAVQSDYLVSRADVTADTNGFAALPKRASVGGVRLVQVLMPGNIAVPLPRMDPADDRGAGVGGAGQPAGYYFDGGGIRLVPQTSSATLRIHYYVTSPQLILETDTTLVARILAVTDLSATTWEVNTTDAGGIVTAVLLADLIGASGTLNDVYGEDVTVVLNLTWTTVQIPKASLRHPPRVNDYILARANNSTTRFTPRVPVIPLPEEMSPVVVLRTAARILESLGYLQEAQQKWQSADTALASARRLLAPRSDGNPKVLRGGLQQALKAPWWPGSDWRW